MSKEQQAFDQTQEFAEAKNEGDMLWSPRFDDVYFDQDEGFEESSYVFVQGNHVQLRWGTDQDFRIGELGFGTGLNLLATWAIRPQKGRLQWFSVEKYPFQTEELAEIWKKWSVPPDFQESFLAQYRTEPGWQKVQIPGLSLHLYIGDVLDFLTTIPQKAQAWYLDGFSPQKNPQMWSVPVTQGVYAATEPQGTIATFSASGLVKANLREAGFEIARKKGFGRKKHMVIGHKTS